MDEFLWNDPLKDKLGTGGVLLADNIRTYVEKYNLLIHKDDFQPERLKGASYSMAPDAYEGWQINGKGETFRLEIKDEENRRYYLVPQNSFVFIGLQERLRLPFYMIGRHNLKISYVYQGLLLGTGPQVDPGYLGRLFIPLHNLTNNDVKIYLNETFVSIDFVRTTPVILDQGKPSNLDEFYDRYRHLNPIPRKKNDRVTLSQYLGKNRPSSSLAELVKRLKKQSKEFARRKTIDLIAFAGAAGIVFAALCYDVAMEQRFDALLDYFKKMEPTIVYLNERNQELVAKQRDLENQINSLQTKINESLTQKPDQTAKPQSPH